MTSTPQKGHTRVALQARSLTLEQPRAVQPLRIYPSSSNNQGPMSLYCREPPYMSRAFVERASIQVVSLIAERASIQVESLIWGWAKGLGRLLEQEGYGAINTIARGTIVVLHTPYCFTSLCPHQGVVEISKLCGWNILGSRARRP